VDQLGVALVADARDLSRGIAKNRYRAAGRHERVGSIFVLARAERQLQAVADEVVGNSRNAVREDLFRTRPDAQVFGDELARGLERRRVARRDGAPPESSGGAGAGSDPPIPGCEPPIDASATNATPSTLMMSRPAFLRSIRYCPPFSRNDTPWVIHSGARASFK
jgi:hypothetical protein